ncbi:MAG: alpha/beta fold hydrolase [Gammaproteobacteria bacterium]
MTPTIRYLDDPHGNSVAYARFGDGPLLVCPCWWVSHAEKDWESAWFRRFFSRLGREFRVVLYDRPGVGLSNREAPPRTLESEVELLASVIDTASGAEKALLFAISCAVPIALSYAAENADRVDKICCYGGYLDGADIATPPVRKLMVDTVRTHWGMGSRALADVFLPDQTREELDMLSKHQRDSASAEKAAELLELTYTMDATDALARLTTELLVIHRTADRAIPCAAGRRLAASIPGTPFVALSGSAHPPWFGATDVLDAAIAFLGGGPLTAEPRSGRDPAAVARAGPLDAPNRRLITPDGPIALTPLEFGVVQHLVDAPGRVVTRDELLEHVWHSPFDGSNKVDAVIRTLRKKLGIRSGSIETVRGHGYSFRDWMGDG